MNNPDRTISVLEPGHSGGCQNQIKSTVMETSKQKSCIVAVNAGFFDPRPGNVCLGILYMMVGMCLAEKRVFERNKE